MKNRAQTRALAVIAITLAAALSACGSTGSSSSSASSPSSSKSPASAAEGDANLLFAQCMREKAFDAAINECMAKMPGIAGDDNIANDPAAREAMVKAAQCLREAGYDVKDPQAGEGISVKDIPEDVLNKCFQQAGAGK